MPQFLILRLDALLALAQMFPVMMTFDLRQWFDQLLLSAVRLQHQFTVHREQGDFVPTVPPMGWHGAPFCGQACAWAIVLFREDALGAPDCGGDSMPEISWLVRDGLPVGAIIVLIDNVGCFFVDDTWRLKWLRRFRRNWSRLNVEVKELFVARPRSSYIAEVDRGGRSRMRLQADGGLPRRMRRSDCGVWHQNHFLRG